MGTKYDFSYKGAILFIEEIGENGYYKIDRYMQSLELSGALSKIKGIVVGGMKNIGGAAEPYDDKAYKIIAENVNKYNIPKIFGFPNGHIADTQPLIIGATVTITVGDEKTTLKYNNQR
ncbi:hypothetical protein [Candidatus Fukatsuia symbiotica]|uniref:hypothetical protein n=1 Tax=Candidatus Fukatsuia symbiotica TaxID=1878942 RepID=UPI001F07D29B|nr:hypothetical protein [Candidatus Fukatsuia symbiotica]